MTGSYERGDVVFGYDPFTDRDSPRPWLISSGDGHPFRGDQYIAITLTSKSYHEGFVPLDEGDWIRGGMPEDSCVVPWGIASPGHADLDHDRYQGRIAETVVDDVARRVPKFLGLDG